MLNELDLFICYKLEVCVCRLTEMLQLDRLILLVATSYVFVSSGSGSVIPGHKSATNRVLTKVCTDKITVH